MKRWTFILTFLGIVAAILLLGWADAASGRGSVDGRAEQMQAMHCGVFSATMCLTERGSSADLMCCAFAWIVALVLAMTFFLSPSTPPPAAMFAAYACGVGFILVSRRP